MAAMREGPEPRRPEDIYNELGEPGVWSREEQIAVARAFESALDSLRAALEAAQAAGGKTRVVLCRCPVLTGGAVQHNPTCAFRSEPFMGPITIEVPAAGGASPQDERDADLRQVVCIKCGYIAVSQSTQEAFDKLRAELGEAQRQREELAAAVMRCGVEIIALKAEKAETERQREERLTQVLYTREERDQAWTRLAETEAQLTRQTEEADHLLRCVQNEQARVRVLEEALRKIGSATHQFRGHFYKHDTEKFVQDVLAGVPPVPRGEMPTPQNDRWDDIQGENAEKDE